MATACISGPRGGEEAAQEASLFDSQATLETTSDTEERVSLIDANRWARAELSEDPLPSHQPPKIVCDPLGTHETDGAFEVDTSYCNYALLTQDLAQDLPAGASVEVLLSHGPLVWTEPAQGHIALALDGQIVWERTVAIPSDAWIYQDVVTLKEDATAGSNWTLHCHNHGANSWRLYGVTWLRGEDASL